MFLRWTDLSESFLSLLQEDFPTSWLKATSSASSLSTYLKGRRSSFSSSFLQTTSIFSPPGTERSSTSTWCVTRRRGSPKVSASSAMRTRGAPSWLWTTSTASRWRQPVKRRATSTAQSPEGLLEIHWLEEKQEVNRRFSHVTFR